MTGGSTLGMGQLESLNGLGLYSVAKHALYGYVKMLREKLRGIGIQVSLLSSSGIAGYLAENSYLIIQQSLLVENLKENY